MSLAEIPTRFVQTVSIALHVFPVRAWICNSHLSSPRLHVDIVQWEEGGASVIRKHHYEPHSECTQELTCCISLKCVLSFFKKNLSADKKRENDRPRGKVEWKRLESEEWDTAHCRGEEDGSVIKEKVMEENGKQSTILEENREQNKTIKRERQNGTEHIGQSLLTNRTEQNMLEWNEIDLSNLQSVVESNRTEHDRSEQSSNAMGRKVA